MASSGDKHLPKGETPGLYRKQTVISAQETFCAIEPGYIPQFQRCACHVKQGVATSAILPIQNSNKVLALPKEIARPEIAVQQRGGANEVRIVHFEKSFAQRIEFSVPRQVAQELRTRIIARGQRRQASNRHCVNACKGIRHSDNSNICRVRWEYSLTLHMIENEKGIRDVLKAFVQSQWARGADPEPGHRTQDIELKRCCVTIVIRAMNTQDDALTPAVFRLDFEPIDFCRNPTGKRICLNEASIRKVSYDRRFQSGLRQ